MKKYRKAVFIVTYFKDNEKILYLVLKRKLHWKGHEFPKGGVENQESLIRAVRRELKEETGLIPKKIKSHKTKGKFGYDRETQKERNFYGQTYHLFSAQASSKKVKLDKKEHSSSSWLPFNKAMRKLTWANQRDSLKKVNNHLKNGI